MTSWSSGIGVPWDALERARDEALESAYARADTWKWGTRGRDRPTPFWNERQGTQAHPLLDAPTRRTTVAYGFDDAGDLCLSLEFDNVPAGTPNLRSPELERAGAWIESPAGRPIHLLASGALSWAGRVSGQRRVYGLALIYSADDPQLPPGLGLGVSEMQADRDRYFPENLTVLDPDPAEFTDVSLRDDCDALHREWQLVEDPTEPRSTLVKIAKRLASEDWSKVLVTTEDFVVYAVDDELTDLERNLRAAKRA